jgi:hypothetical protein
VRRPVLGGRDFGINFRQRNEPKFALLGIVFDNEHAFAMFGSSFDISRQTWHLNDQLGTFAKPIARGSDCPGVHFGQGLRQPKSNSQAGVGGSRSSLREQLKQVV